MNLLMISGDQDLIEGKKGPFYYLLQEFSRYWGRIDVICKKSDGLKQFQIFNNIYVYGGSFSKREIVEKATEIYQHSQFNLITAHDYPPFKHSRAAAQISKKFKIPYLIEIHHIVGYPQAADLKEFLLKNYYKIFFKNITKEAKAVRVVNQRQVPEFLINLGVPKEKIIYLPSFYIDQRIFYPRNLEKKYDLLFVGRLVNNKGLDLLIKVLKLLKKDLLNFKIAIVGKGPKEDWLKLKIKDEELINNIEFLDWVGNNQELASIYNQAKILLITSDNEGGPRVGLEAMACGIPVISTKVGIMIDLIKNDENGYLVDWTAEEFVTQIKTILNDSELSRKLSENARQTAQVFSYNKLIKDYATTLQKLI